jgi:hypothetical protein
VADAVQHHLSKERETKNKVVYSNENFGAIYVSKPDAERMGNPEEITVTLQAKGG